MALRRPVGAARAAGAERRARRASATRTCAASLDARPRLNRRTGLLAARRNIAYHYDLGNELFALFLDETMTYSCAVFERDGRAARRRAAAQAAAVCDKLELGPDDHVLEIGCGWGSFALTAAASTARA